MILGVAKYVINLKTEEETNDDREDTHTTQEKLSVADTQSLLNQSLSGTDT